MYPNGFIFLSLKIRLLSFSPIHSLQVTTSRKRNKARFRKLKSKRLINSGRFNYRSMNEKCHDLSQVVVLAIANISIKYTSFV